MVEDLKSYENKALNLLKLSELVTDIELSCLKDYGEELLDTFVNSQMFRTETEMRMSVLNDIKFPTPDSKYWQSVREQNVMFRELVSLSYEYRKNVVEIKKLKRDLEKENDELEKELLNIEIEKQEFGLLNFRKVAKDRIREIKLWSNIKKELLPNMKYSLVDVDEHQLISYAQRFIRQANVSKGVGSPSELHNLYGQLQTSVKIINEKGLLNKLYNGFEGYELELVKTNITKLLEVKK